MRRNLLQSMRISFSLMAVILSVIGGFAGEVDSQRLNNAAKEPHNWLTYGGDYSARRYSALDQINRGNIGKLSKTSASRIILHSGQIL